MLTQPMQGEVISNPYPEIRANLATLGNIDPKSVEMRLSGFGIVPAKYNPETKTISYQCTRRIREKTCTVLISARANGKRVETQWTFYVDPNATPTPAPPQPAEAETQEQPAPAAGGTQPST